VLRAGGVISAWFRGTAWTPILLRHSLWKNLAGGPPDVAHDYAGLTASCSPPRGTHRSAPDTAARSVPTKLRPAVPLELRTPTDRTSGWMDYSDTRNSGDKKTKGAALVF